MAEMDLWGIWLYYAAKEQMNMKQSMREPTLNPNRSQNNIVYEESGKGAFDEGED